MHTGEALESRGRKTFWRLKSNVLPGDATDGPAIFNMYALGLLGEDRRDNPTHRAPGTNVEQNRETSSKTSETHGDTKLYENGNYSTRP